jgi:CheY-like chemotaxis protein
VIAGDNRAYYSVLAEEIAERAEALEITGISQEPHEIKKLMPEIIMLDINGDGKNGIKLARRLMADTVLSGIPLMVCSTFNIQYIAEEEIKAQYKNELNFYKPYSIDEIINGLLSVVSEYRAYDDIRTGKKDLAINVLALKNGHDIIINEISVRDSAN